MNTLFDAFAQGAIIRDAEYIPAASLAWNEHKTCAGVFLKNLLAGECMNGIFSCHLVRIDPNMSIGLHSHPDSIELHEVIAGSGACVAQGVTLPYAPGTISVIARDMPHEVHANEDGLYMFAKFVSLQS